MKDEKQIYISDLDGTLLQDDATISPYAKDLLIELLDRGVNFTVASARSLASVRQILCGIPFALPVISINGAFISDFATGEHVFINDMDKGAVVAVYELIRNYHCYPFMSTFDGAEDRVYYQRVANDGMGWFQENRVACGDDSVRHAKDIESKFEENVVAFAVINTFEKLKPLAEKIESEFAGCVETHFFENIYSPPWWWLTIHDKKSCKSIAVKKLVEDAGFGMDELTVFGDRLNDLEMFKVAGRSVAVRNACDEIKGCATEVIGANTEDSVVKFLVDENE
jgi:hypothetical protein